VTQQVGKYQLIRKLATGGMAEVFLAKAAGPMGFEKTLVLKRILPHLAEESSFVEMFLGEAKLAAQLTHPHIAQIFDFGEAEGSYFLAMEYVDGPSLRTLIKRSVNQAQPLPPALCARLVSQACEGLAFAHDFVDPETGESLGLIHRDISPDNILLSRQGAVKVVDFGIAKAAGQGHKTRSGVIKGKLAYMPPEQLRARDMDRRVDVYALGVVLYELLTGQRPYTSDSDAGLMQAILFESPVPVAQLRANVPESLQHILERALTKEPAQRYPDCHALQSDLEDFILSVGKPVTTHQVAQLIQSLTQGGQVPPPGFSPTPLPSATPTPRSDASGPGRSPSTGPLPATRSTPRREREAPEPVSRTHVTPPPPEEAAEPAADTQVQVRDAARGELAASDARAKRRSPLFALALVGGVLGAAGGAWWLHARTQAPSEAPRPTARPPEVALAPPKPAAEPSPPPPTEPAPVPGVTDAGVAALEPTARPEPEVAPAPPAEPPGPVREPSKPKRTVPSPPKVALKGTLELRIRPYATVFVDGRELGDTPLAPVELTVGSHSVKLVNAKLSKVETHRVVIQAERTVTLKRNLLEE
jgi:eukaryotic-like serine/threonine-protein kinase